MKISQQVENEEKADRCNNCEVMKILEEICRMKSNENELKDIQINDLRIVRSVKNRANILDYYVVEGDSFKGTNLSRIHHAFRLFICSKYDT